MIERPTKCDKCGYEYLEKKFRGYDNRYRKEYSLFCPACDHVVDSWAHRHEESVNG